MAHFLGIYHKANKINLLDIAEVVNDFTLNNSREIIRKEFPGMLLLVAERFKNNLFNKQDSWSFISGHISFEGFKGSGESSVAGKLELCMSDPEIYLPQLEGAFALLNYSASTHTLTFANDKFGIFPLFIYEDDNYIMASSEYQPLIKIIPVKKRKPDYTAVAEFFTLGVITGSKTFYRQINNLTAASCFVSKGKQVSCKKYWQVLPPADKAPDPLLLSEDLFLTFKKINQEYTDTHSSDLYLLSAGADSRLIFATLTAEQQKKILFYTSNLSFLSPEEDKDVIGASLLSKKFGLKHCVEKISFYEKEFGKTYFDNERVLREHHVCGGWHGGEFLGGYLLNAAPIKKDLTFKEVDQKLKSIFHWRFRIRLSTHPYKAYQQEKEKFHSSVSPFLFMAEQFTRSFFTSIYGGSRGFWLQPYQLTHHGFSPFWDSRFLKKLVHVPMDLLSDYGFYNEVLKHCEKEFTSIPSNSPLTNRADSIMPKLTAGLEPKGQLKNMHHTAFIALLKDVTIRKRKFYRKAFLETAFENESAPLTKQLIDFETWYARYMA